MALSDSTARRVVDNLARVRESIAAAAARSGRVADEVRLVAVTKYVEPEVARLLREAGCEDLGESRPQELWRKAEALHDLSIRWHLIGHLQSNKIRRTLPLCHRIHSVDRWSLLTALNAEAAAQPSQVAVLLEVNVAGEAAKHGFAPEELSKVVARLDEVPRLDVRGLMTMGPHEGGDAAARQAFAGLRRLAEAVRPLCAARTDLAELSMGMSGDYEIGIEEGATLVRVGSALFEGVEE